MLRPKRKEINISAINGSRIIHVGTYFDDKTAKRVVANIEYFAGKNFKVYERYTTGLAN